MEDHLLEPHFLHLKKGQLLFAAGEISRSMYLLHSGSIRLFVKKGNINIELDTIHSGQILGELSFLDGMPRSVSGEALNHCILIEISNDQFTDVLKKSPEWLKILLKTVIGRLRSANVRILESENENQTAQCSDKERNHRLASFEYLSWIEFIKVSMILLLVSNRNQNQEPSTAAETKDSGIHIKELRSYTHKIIGVPVSKLLSVLDILSKMELISLTGENEKSFIFLKDPFGLEMITHALYEQCQLEPENRQTVSPLSYDLLSQIVHCIHHSLSEYIPDPETGLVTLDLYSILKNHESLHFTELLEKKTLTSIQELIQLKCILHFNHQPNTSLLVTFHPRSILKSHRFFSILLEIQTLNEQKKKLPNHTTDLHSSHS